MPTEPAAADAPAPPPADCLNCGARLAGAFCSACGQRRDVHVKSVGEVFHDVGHTLTHVDSRLWQTLRLLVLRPGELTREFFRGRLASYLPPFRLYLVLSLAYFTVAALVPGNDFVRLDRDGSGAVPAQQQARQACELEGSLPGRLGERLEAACNRVAADGGRRLADTFAATAPKLMFVLMPLAAAFALLLYWRPRRLYAEHLVFFLHGHALLFLFLTGYELLDGLGRLLPAAAGVVLAVPAAVGLLWLPWYYYRAMRAVYGQGRPATLAKFVALALAYFVLLAVTVAGGVVYAALSL